MDAKQVASFFIKQASNLNGNNDLTNLKLQKLLFYAQAEYLRKHGQPLFKDQIEAWEYGPVVRDVYDWLKDCGAYQIDSFDVDLADFDNVDDDLLEELKDIFKKYNKYSASFLVEKTHEKGSPWHQVYSKKTSNSIIPITMIAKAKLANVWQ